MAPLGKNMWPPSSSQLKKKVMRELRARIRKGTHASPEEVQRALEKLPIQLIPEALRAKALQDGQTILAYAASCGNADLFIYLAEKLLKECGTEALVKELREFDINGAPLLFLAASSRSTSECFHKVFHVLRAFLGTGGLLEQFKAHDHLGRNILMYAARGKDKDIFRFVRDMDDDRFVCTQRHAEEEPSGTRNASNAKDEDGHDRISGGNEIMQRFSCIPDTDTTTHVQNGYQNQERGPVPYPKGTFKQTNQNAYERAWGSHETSVSTDRSIEAACKCCSSARVFQAVRDICRLASERTRSGGEGNGDTHAPLGTCGATIWASCPVKNMWTQNLHRDISSPNTRSPERWVDRVANVDHTGKNILHHAAEAASLAVLNLVLDLVRHVGKDVRSLMAKVDRNERTPIMLFLRNKYDDDDDAHAKMTSLWNSAGSEGWMKQRPVPPVWEIESTGEPGGQSPKSVTVGNTELFHAAHGGLARLELAIEFIRKASQCFGVERCGDDVSLDKVLDMKTRSSSDGEIQDSLNYDFLNILHRGKWLVNQSQKISASETLNKMETVRNRGKGMLLAAAVKGGHVEVIKRVEVAIKMGCLCPQTEAETSQGSKAIEEAIIAIQESGRSLFKLAIMSGKANAANYVYHNIICRYFQEQSQVWELLRGQEDENSPLTFAAATPMTAEDSGVEMLKTVYCCLHEAATKRFGSKDGDKEIKKLLCFASHDSSTDQTSPPVSPLGTAALRNNWVLFRLLYDMYEVLQGHRWSREQVLSQLPKNAPRAFSFEKNHEMHEFRPHEDMSFTSGDEGLSSVMWHDIVQAYRYATPVDCSDEQQRLQSWREYFKAYSRRAVEEANYSRSFGDLRELVKEGFPLHDEQIPELLKNIEDHEHDVIDIVMFAIGNASNPLVMSAGVSRNVKMAVIKRPMHRTSLRRLQKMVDEMVDELLDKLPHTVRRVGMSLLRPIVPENGLSSNHQRCRGILANLAGFIAVEWMLEPRLLFGEDSIRKNYDGPNYIDPLQRAVHRGSEDLGFINNPLVIDYVLQKFNCSLPHWASKKPSLASVNGGFYTFGDFDRYKLSDLLEGKSTSPENKNVKSRTSWDTHLLRFLQGWDPDRENMNDALNDDHGRNKKKGGKTLDRNSFPRSTILPGLQFLLAGVIGKPETFYEVPVIRFSFELFIHLVMLILFCSCLIFKRHDCISSEEWTFYFFVAGLVWREVQEFLDGMPARQLRKGRPGGNEADGKDLNRMVTGLMRYILHDTWNLLDVSSIIFVLLAFIFRLRGLPENGGPKKPGDDFFLAQFFLACSLPLFFSRLLILSQIDGTLGPMIQILWRLMFHTIRFSAFIVVILTSFALAFYALFISCDEDSNLFIKFGTFPSALLTIFAAALGEFGDIIEELKDIDIQCGEIPAKDIAYIAGVFFLVTYLVIMAVVLLNLLIAVLSSEHQKVQSKGDMEFHLARTRLIMHNSIAVAHRRIPAPFNLIQVGIGFIFDGLKEIWWQCQKLRRYLQTYGTRCSELQGPERVHSSLKGRTTNNSTGQTPMPVSRKESMPTDEHAETFKPVTLTYNWFTFEGFLQRFTFALTMSLAAVVVSAFLWMISLPWFAWSLQLWFYRWVQSHRASQNENQGDKEKKTSRNERLGHFRIFFWTIFGVTLWIIFLVFAAVLCAVCCIASLILWVRGLFGVIEWACWRQTDEGRKMSGRRQLDCPTAMPGQERGGHWEHAWEVVRAGNHRIRQVSESAHFHILPLLKSTTGLDMERLVMVIKHRNAKSDKDCKECRDMDKRATQALFSPQMQFRPTSPPASDVIGSGVEETKDSTR